MKKEIREYLLKSEGFRVMNERDYFGYAGAEKFVGGQWPVIKKSEKFTIIFDANGFSFINEEGDDEIMFDNVMHRV